MKRFWKNNGLSVVMLGLFAVFLIGQSVAGWLHYNNEQQEHAKDPVSYTAYLRSGEFLESVFENWESEFLQMAAFVFLAAFLRQRGSSESKSFDEDERSDPRKDRTPDSPGPVHRGGLALTLYSRSLSLALAGLFVFSFAMHAVTGVRKYNEEAAEHGQPLESIWGYVTGSQFWFESLQNWQSEFLAVGALVLLTIFLRQKDSPQSKAVHEAHAKTGK